MGHDGGMSRPLGDYAGPSRTIQVPASSGLAPHRLVVTINRDEAGKIVEVFAKYELPGPEGQMGLLNAACRLASRLLQVGVPTEEVAKMMRGQADGWPPVPWKGGGLCVSAADGIARLLEETT